MTQNSTYSKISAEDLHEKLEGEGDIVLIDPLPAYLGDVVEIVK